VSARHVEPKPTPPEAAQLDRSQGQRTTRPQYAARGRAPRAERRVGFANRACASVNALRSGFRVDTRSGAGDAWVIGFAIPKESGCDEVAVRFNPASASSARPNSRSRGWHSTVPIAPAIAPDHCRKRSHSANASTSRAAETASPSPAEGAARVRPGVGAVSACGDCCRDDAWAEGVRSWTEAGSGGRGNRSGLHGWVRALRFRRSTSESCARSGSCNPLRLPAGERSEPPAPSSIPRRNKFAHAPSVHVQKQTGANRVGVSIGACGLTSWRRAGKCDADNVAQTPPPKQVSARFLVTDEGRGWFGVRSEEGEGMRSRLPATHVRTCRGAAIRIRHERRPCNRFLIPDSPSLTTRRIVHRAIRSLPHIPHRLNQRLNLLRRRHRAHAETDGACGEGADGAVGAGCAVQAGANRNR